MPGFTRVIFEDNQVLLNSAWPGMFDPGIPLVDGATYEVIISAMAGTTGTQAVLGNWLVPVILNSGGTQLGYIGTLPSSGITILDRLLFTFRYQERAVALTSANKSIALNTIGDTVGSVKYGTAINVDADAASISASTYPTLNSSFVFRQTVAAADQLRIGFVTAGGGLPNANLRMLVKVTERLSSVSFN